MLLVVLEREHFGVAVGEYLLYRVVIRHVQLEVCLEFDVLGEVFEFSLAQLFIEGNFFIFLIQMGLVGGSDYFSKFTDQFKDAHFEKGVEEVFVSLEVCEDHVFVEEVVESLLLD